MKYDLCIVEKKSSFFTILIRLKQINNNFYQAMRFESICFTMLSIMKGRKEQKVGNTWNHNTFTKHHIAHQQENIKLNFAGEAKENFLEFTVT